MAISTLEQTNLVRLVVGMFNAAPGATYFNTIANIFESNGHNLQATATLLAGTSAFQSLYSTGLTSQQFADSFLTTLGLQSNALAQAYVFGQAELGVNRGQIILNAITILSTTTATDFQAAKAMLANKVEVATFYSITPLHVAELNLGVLQNVLSTITADHATVVAQEALLSFVPPQTFTLTTGVDVINPASGVNSVVNGTVDAAGTFTVGDTITGNATTVLNLAVNGLAPSLSTVSGVGTVNINSIVTSTVNADLWSGINAVNLVVPTLPGTVTTLSNAQVAPTTYAINGNTGSLTVTFRDTAGAADTAHGSLTGAGTSTVSSVLDLSSANTVEALTLATAGTNFATVNGGTADKTITITGAGVNTLTFGATAATLTVDASATTAAQKLTFAAGSIGAEDTIKGGSAADTVTANSSTTFAHMTGVETFVTTVDGGVGLFDGANVSGLKTVTINQGTSAGAEFFSNMKAEFGTLNVNGPTVTQDVNFVTGANANLTVNYGAGSTKFDDHFDGLTVDEVQTLTVNFAVGGIAGVNMGTGDINLDKADTSSLTLSQNGSDDTVTVDVHRADALDNLTINATADNSSISVSVDIATNVDVQGLQTLSLTASGISSEVFLNEWDSIGFSLNGTGSTTTVSSTTNAMSLTTLTVTASGNTADATISSDIVSVGHLGTVTFTASGNSSFAGMSGYGTSGGHDLVNVGNVGTITMTASGNSSSAGINDGDMLIFGDLGSLNLVASGTDASAYIFGSSGYGNGDVTVWGDVGDVNLTASGNDSTASIDGVLTVFGSVGNIVLTASGHSATASIDSISVTGDVGSIQVIASGTSSTADVFGATVGGSLNQLTVTASGDDSEAYISMDQVSGDVGTITITASGSNASAFLNTDMTISGDLTSLVVTASGDGATADFGPYDITVAGNVGTIAVTASGSSSTADASLFVDGNVGVVTVTASGADSTASIDLTDNDGSMTVSSLSIIASGADSTASADIITGSGVLGAVVIQATKANSSATLNFTGNTFGSIAATSASPSSDIDLFLNNTTSAGGTITASGSGTLDIVLSGKSITSLAASGETNKVTMTVNATNATTGMTLTTGSAADNVQGGKGVDTFNLGGGADTFNFSNLAAGSTDLSAVTDIIAGGFVSGTDHLKFLDAPGTSANYVEVLTPAATLAAYAAAANTALNGTVKYYFGVVGTDGFLAYDADGTGTTSIIQITGITDIAPTDISAGVAAATILITPTTDDGSTANGATTPGTVLQTVAAGAFTSGFDHLDGPVAGSGTNYVETLAATASLTTFSAAAEAALNGTVLYYFGVIGTNGFLAYDPDATGIATIVQLTGVVDMAATDIV